MAIEVGSILAFKVPGDTMAARRKTVSKGLPLSQPYEQQNQFARQDEPTCVTVMTVWGKPNTIFLDLRPASQERTHVRHCKLSQKPKPGRIIGPREH